MTEQQQPPTVQADPWAFWRWRWTPPTGHPQTERTPDQGNFLRRWFWIGAFLVLFGAVVPVAAAALAHFKDSDVNRIIMEFGLGTWPNQASTPDSWFIFGVGLRAFVLLGVPAILGLSIYFFQKRLEGRLKEMRFDNYMANYRMFLGTEMVRMLKLWVDELGLDPQTAERLILERAEGAQLSEDRKRLFAWLGEMHDPATVIERVESALRRADEAWNVGRQPATIEFSHYVDVPSE